MRYIFLAFRYAWAFPATVVGLMLAAVALCAGATVRPVDGFLEVAGGQIGRGISLLPPSIRFVAITFGHVIIGRDHVALRRLRSHEHVHVHQYERWGALFFPLYLASSIVQLALGRDPYSNNYFELEAHACAGPQHDA